MVYEYRNGIDYFYGQLSTAAAVSDTTLTAAAFASLPSTFSTTSYLPLVLHDPTLGLEETVWVTAHTAASTSVTVVRGRQGTTARAWPSSTQVVDAPTVRDVTYPLARASLPTDAHVGMRVPVTDEGIVVQRAYNGGRWEADVGVGLPSEFGYRQDASAIPASSVLMMRGGCATSVTNASSQFAVVFKSPFPNQALTANITWHSGTPGGLGFAIYPGTLLASGFTVYVFSLATGALSGAGASVVYSYTAVGY
ncbi:hypothetical protein [Lentzea kentuckyensis]|uniref:hypothetical protein n=1 Tax=Lentzea kentuckyensis TaxID=360086 RepID=UPI000A3CE313|nr:hypothetical protein [Lentzea kentuckyensis]